MSKCLEDPAHCYKFIFRILISSQAYRIVKPRSVWNVFYLTCSNPVIVLLLLMSISSLSIQFNHDTHSTSYSEIQSSAGKKSPISSNVVRKNCKFFPRSNLATEKRRSIEWELQEDAVEKEISKHSP